MVTEAWVVLVSVDRNVLRTAVRLPIERLATPGTGFLEFGVSSHPHRVRREGSASSMTRAAGGARPEVEPGERAQVTPT